MFLPAALVKCGRKQTQKQVKHSMVDVMNALDQALSFNMNE